VALACHNPDAFLRAGLPLRCSGRASRREIVAMFETDVVLTAISLVIARR